MCALEFTIDKMNIKKKHRSEISFIQTGEKHTSDYKNRVYKPKPYGLTICMHKTEIFILSVSLNTDKLT